MLGGASATGFVYFNFFEALNSVIGAQFFQGYIKLCTRTLLETLIACWGMRIKCVKMKALLNNSFNLC